jgi:hypothetical protein
MQKIQNFFLVCSGVNKSILKRTPSEINKYTGIGATIFFTGVFAWLASSYAIYTVFQSYLAATAFGFIWGLMIFNLDRYIVSTFKKSGNFFRDSFTTLPRLALAILIAVVIAKPLELKIFDTEIQSEIALMQQENLKEQETLVKSRFENDIATLKNEIQNYKSEINEKTVARDNLSNEAIKEADGTGGSQKRNMGPIYGAKKAEADKAQAELDAISLKNNNIIINKESALDNLVSESQRQTLELNAVSLNGLAARIEAQSRLNKKSSAIYMASIFIILLFIAIETAPIFVKLISRRGPYDYVLDKHEYAFEMNHKVIINSLSQTAESKILFEKETMGHKTKLAIDAEKEISKKALHDHLENIKDQPLIWKDLLRKGRLFQLD